jgi:hypothetical protein
MLVDESQSTLALYRFRAGTESRRADLTSSVSQLKTSTASHNSSVPLYIFPPVRAPADGPGDHLTQSLTLSIAPYKL